MFKFIQCLKEEKGFDEMLARLKTSAAREGILECDPCLPYDIKLTINHEKRSQDDCFCIWLCNYLLFFQLSFAYMNLLDLI